MKACRECERRIGAKYRRRKKPYAPPVLTACGLKALLLDQKKPIVFSNEYRRMVEQVLQEKRNDGDDTETFNGS